RAKADYLIDLIDAFSRPANTADLIDIGCGIANSHPLLTGRVRKLAGVDVSETCIAKAANDNPENDYRCFDGVTLPFNDASFDVASAVCVFHHVRLAHRAMLARDARRILRRKGLFAIFEHNPLNPLTMHVVNTCEFDKEAVLLRRAETERLLKE